MKKMNQTETNTQNRNVNSKASKTKEQTNMIPDLELEIRRVNRDIERLQQQIQEALVDLGKEL